MSNIKKDIAGLTRPIICKRCGKRLGFIKLKPALQKLLENKNKKETWAYIWLIAFVTQFVTQFISDIVLRHFGL